MNGNPVILILIGQFFAVADIKRLTLQKRLVSTLSDITKVTVQYFLVIRSVAYKRTTLTKAESKPTEYTTALHRGPLKYCKMNNNRPNKKRRTNRMKSPEEIPAIAAESVLVKSEKMADDAVTVKGYDFNRGVDYHELLQSYTRTGFQAHHFGKAVEEINRMISCKLEAIPEDKRQVVNMNPCKREQTNCTIFLSYTSNMISSGVRETLRYLVEHNMVDCIVTTAGGIEEDIIKCLAHMYLGDFKIPGKDLRQRGINRTGNLLCPNDNYCKFEDWIMPVLDDMLEEQEAQGTNWTPSKMIARLGKEIDNPESVCYWAYKNNIPIFSPALTDGSVGDMLYFHSYKNPGLRLDLIEDVRRMNNQAVYAVNTGMIILGGGVIKHHVCNANMMRNGADFAVYVNTAQEFDGSDAGASPDEAVSWGKIRATAKPVKVHGDATIIFPLLVAETFARNFPTTTTTKSSKAD